MRMPKELDEALTDYRINALGHPQEFVKKIPNSIYTKSLNAQGFFFRYFVKKILNETAESPFGIFLLKNYKVVTYVCLFILFLIFVFAEPI